MKLWTVRRRVPLMRGDRKVYIERTIAMAATPEDAIALVKGDADVDTSTPEGERYALLFLSGKWTAHEIEAPCTFGLGSVSDEPTEAEIVDRKTRIKLSDERRKNHG
jgi:hypothetical protein